MEKSGNSAEPVVYRGLEGILAAETKVGFVDGQEGRLSYRGYDINTLAEQSNYEEVSYLLIYGHMPNQKEYTEYVERLRSESDLPEEVYDLIRKQAGKTHPMTSLRTAVSYLATFDVKESASDPESQEVMAVKLVAKMPTLVGAIHRIFSGKDILKPDRELSYAANFFYMSLGRRPDPMESKMMDTALIIHADHGMNASTFSALVTISTMADMYSAITSAISTLKGPLHGGANERALMMIQAIGSPGNAEKALSEMVERKEKIMGFGHRVYKVYDPRAKILKQYAQYITEKNNKNLFLTANKIEELMINRFGSKGIFPNVDFYSGMVYSALGFKTEIFTPIFAVGRISGWVARSLEYIQDNKLFRPKAKYVGEKGPLKYKPINERD
ncbi:MAG: citrate/2-methylcitrate synthase [Candidatus Thermoplasmatota archaeon]|jgi:citrate synthase|nr:citrate/2-methylcitrate synthase [Candidatus Thermoplasmatota archaeon]MCL5791073.1 citrate/2-methylcitrate synthase [Candidatus Thermoplasmatota archaeon]